jgi:hypothetical protein
VSSLSTFLPVCFDEFGSFTISGSYQATLLEYRFSQEDSQKGSFECLQEYLSAATHRCKHYAK